jgi:hypothetical protein
MLREPAGKDARATPWHPCLRVLAASLPPVSSFQTGSDKKIPARALKHRRGALDQLQGHTPRIPQHDQLIAIRVGKNFPFRCRAGFQQAGANGRNVRHGKGDVQNLRMNRPIIRGRHGGVAVEFQHYLPARISQKVRRNRGTLPALHGQAEVLAIPFDGEFRRGKVKSDMLKVHAPDNPPIQT